MKSLRLRIVLTWLCYLVIGIVLLTGLFKYPAAMLIIVIFAFASVALRFITPRFPKRAHTKVQALVLLPLFALLVVAKSMLTDPTRQQVILVGWWVVIAASLIFQAYEDKRVWTSDDVVA
jgi:hypothetical protein